MYYYLEDKEFLKQMKGECADIVNRLVQEINREDFMKAQAHLVGSGAKNLIMQNGNEAVDLDYNLEVTYAQCGIKRASEIKEYIHKKFDQVLQKAGWGSCSDSTSCLSTKKIHFKKGNPTAFSVDLAIVYRDDEEVWYRLIHNKTGYVKQDSWIWNIAPDSKGLVKKANRIKKSGRWQELRESYKNKKNMYLTRGESENHPSFICYIEAVNEVSRRCGS